MPSARSGVAVRPRSSTGLEVVEQPAVGRRLGVVELVHHDHLELLRLGSCSTPRLADRDCTDAKT